MWTFSQLLRNFFTHKDFLPAAETIPGTMFTPLHFVFAALCLAAVIGAALLMSRRSERARRAVFGVLWGLTLVLELTKIVWESFTGATVGVEWAGVMPLYPCSIFMIALPLIVFGKGNVHRAGCGYVCTLGLLGGSINFVYPATILGNYSCISFAGFHTFFYHGAIVFCALTLLLSGDHSFRGVTKWSQLLIPALPCLGMSVAANLVNFSPVGSDYMFFKLQSFIFAPIGRALPVALCVAIVYLAYLMIHALPYLPSFVANRRHAKG